MSDEMGTFRIDVEIENPARPGERHTLRAVLVDTGAELSWAPAAVLESLGVARNNQWLFRQADGTILERWTGSVLVAVAGKRAADEVVFGEPGDLTLLGSRTLEGLNFRVEPVTRRLVDAGPVPAAVAAFDSMKVLAIAVSLVGVVVGCDPASNPIIPSPAPPPPPAAQGMLAGVVRDSSGAVVPQAVVCATGSYEYADIPHIFSYHVTASSAGHYLLPVNLTLDIDVEAAVGVAATPPPASGLAPALKSGLTLAISSTVPPAETTFADIVVPEGTPYEGVFCAG